MGSYGRKKLVGATIAPLRYRSTVMWERGVGGRGGGGQGRAKGDVIRRSAMRAALPAVGMNGVISDSTVSLRDATSYGVD